MYVKDLQCLVFLNSGTGVEEVFLIKKSDLFLFVSSRSLIVIDFIFCYFFVIYFKYSSAFM